MSEPIDSTRALTSFERGLLQLMLSQPFPGVVELRAQAEVATFQDRGHYGDITLFVPETTPKAKTIGSVPVAASWYDTHDPHDWNESVRMELFVFEGRMEEITRLNFGYDSPRLPPLTEFTVEICDEDSPGNRPPRDSLG